MDLFGRNKIKDLSERIKYLNDTIESLRKRNLELSKPIEFHKNRYRTFEVCMRNGGKFVVKCRRFEHDLNGYRFYEADPTFAFDRGYTTDGHMVGHIDNAEVWKIFEAAE